MTTCDTAMPWSEVKDLLHEAMQLAPDERTRFLDRVCPNGTALRAELESLLSAVDALPSDFMAASPSLADDESIPLQPEQIFAEHFRLIRKVGEGGMGQVWLAEQVAPVRRPVALKLIKAGIYDATVVQRFEAERQSLAIMDHPAIAKIFDAGTTELGQPYFVMEYVPGLPITEYCDRNGLTVQQRLRLFIKACEGVQHAHERSVIHRDLKPANVLVVEVDGNPVPRIIDFGLAKLIVPAGGPSPIRAGDSRMTQMGIFAGTPGFMSPEQMDGRAGEVDTRTDVFSLGVILYILLTGSTPFERWLSPLQSFDDYLRRLRETDPPLPSYRTGGDREELAAVAAARGSRTRQLLATLRGDLDWIVMKALARDPAHRYRSPSDLSADLRRYLEHWPVSAHPASGAYQLKKYARRHRVAVSVTAAAAVLFIAFSIVQAVQVVRITHERDRATRITDFMTRMFQVVDPSEARGSSVTAREILDKASRDIERDHAMDPDVELQLMQVMARTYRNLGLYAHAHTLAQRTWEARRRRYGTDDPRTLESMSLLGNILSREGDRREAMKLTTNALTALRSAAGSDAPVTLEAANNLASILAQDGQYRAAEVLAQDNVNRTMRVLGPDHVETARALILVGNALWYQGRYSEAEGVQRRALETARRVWGEDHPTTMQAMQNVAIAVASQGRFTEADPLYRDLLSVYRRVLGPEHQETLRATENLAAMLTMEGRLQDAETTHREALQAMLRTLGPEHDLTLLCEFNLAEVLLKEGRYAEAEQLQRSTLATQIRVLGPESPHTLISQSNLAAILTAEGRQLEAESLARNTFEAQSRTLGPYHPNTVDTLLRLGNAMSLAHHYADADELFHRVIDTAGEPPGRGEGWVIWRAFARMAAAADHPDEAVAHLREAVARGYSDADELLREEEFKSLMPNPDFQKLVASLRTPRPLSAVP